MAESRAVFCGLARDVADVLPDNVARLEALAAGFADHGFVIYENDSEDGTPDLLADWQRVDPRVHVETERLGVPRFAAARELDRAAWLARCRNRLRERVLERFGGFDWVVAVDLDLLGFCREGFASSFGYEPFDAMGANGMSFRDGRPVFFDCWAFRTLDRSEPF